MIEISEYIETITSMQEQLDFCTGVCISLLICLVITLISSFVLNHFKD